MSSVPTDLLDIVSRIRELTEAGQIEWKESIVKGVAGGGRSIEFSLASGHWQLILLGATRALRVNVRDETGSRIYGFRVEPDDPHFTDFKSVFDSALGAKLERARSAALVKMREELAAR